MSNFGFAFLGWCNIQITSPDHWLFLIQVTNVRLEVDIPLFFGIQILGRKISILTVTINGLGYLQAHTRIDDIGTNEITSVKLEGNNPPSHRRWVRVAGECVIDVDRLVLGQDRNAGW